MIIGHPETSPEQLCVQKHVLSFRRGHDTRWQKLRTPVSTSSARARHIAYLCAPFPLSFSILNWKWRTCFVCTVFGRYPPWAFIQLPGNVQLWMLGSCLQRRDSALRIAIAAIACMPNCPTLHLWLEVQLSLNWDISLKQMWDFEYGFKKLLRPEAGAVMRLHRRPIVFFNVESKKGNCKLQLKNCNNSQTHQLNQSLSMGSLTRSLPQPAR
jgi:hypothetical protein